MLKSCENLMMKEIRYMSHWLQVWLMNQYPAVEIALVGKNAIKFRKEIDKVFFPNKVMCGTLTESTLPFLENRWVEETGKTQIFVCQNKVCRLPADSISSALRQLKLIKEDIYQKNF
jgi:uncharacterized protein YyaL (SSP411 family)